MSFRKQKAPRGLRAVGPKVKDEDFLGEVTFQLRPTRHDVGTTGQCKCPDFGAEKRQVTYRGVRPSRGTTSWGGEGERGGTFTEVRSRRTKSPGKGA